MNGLSAASALVEGQSLIVPPGVTNNSYNASTFRPYEAGEAMGDLSPTTPKPPKKNKCGILSQVLMVAVSLAVTALLPQVSAFFSTFGGNILGAMLASGASQAFGVATGTPASRGSHWNGMSRLADAEKELGATTGDPVQTTSTFRCAAG